jgi:hypothetical protein
MKIVFKISDVDEVFDITVNGYSEPKSFGVEFLKIYYDILENFVNMEKYCGDRILKVCPNANIYEGDVIRYTHELVKLHERRKNEIYDLFMKDNDYKKYVNDNKKLEDEIVKSSRTSVVNHLGEIKFSDGEIWYFLYYSPERICVSQIMKNADEVDLDIDWLRYKWKECVCGKSEDVDVFTHFDKNQLMKGKSCRHCGSLDVERGEL